MEISAPKIDMDMSDYGEALDPYQNYPMFLEQLPVFRFRSGNFVLCRYDDVKAALRNWQVFREGVSSEARGDWWLPPDCRHEIFLISKCPPEHDKLRSLVNKNYIPAMINQYVPAITEKTGHLLNLILNQGQPIDIVEHFAYPLASTASSLATGISDNPSHSETIRRWTYLSELNAPDSPESHRIAAIEETRKLIRIYENLIEERTKHPRSDLVSLLLTALVDHEPLSHTTIFGALGLFLSAGFLTTAQSVSAAFLELARQPALRQQLTQNPELIPAFIEELLRFSGPTHSVLRQIKEPTTLHGITIPEGSLVHLLIGAANRDPRHFDTPDRFILGRPNIKTHVAFGHGIHICIGAALVRLVLHTTLTEMIKRFSSYRMSVVSESWSCTLFTRGLDRLEIAIEKSHW